MTNFHNKIKSLFYLTPVLVLSACTLTQSGQMTTGQMDLEVRNAQRSSLDVSTERESEAIRRFLMAELSYEAEQTDDALSDFKASSKLVTKPDPEIQTSLAKLYISQGDLESAQEALVSFNENSQALLLKAAIKQSLGQWKDATDLYSAALELQSNCTECKLMLGLSSLQNNALEQARTLIEGVIVVDEKNLPGLKLLAITENKLGNQQRYTELATIVGRMDQSDLSLLGSDLPTPTELRQEMGRYSLIKQNFDEAITHLSLLLAEKPRNDEIRYTLALALSSTGRVKEAMKRLEEISAKSPWFIRASTFAGILYKQRGDLKKSEEAFRAALKYEPGSEALQVYLAAVLRDAKKYKEAKVVYQELLKKQPNNQNIAFNYAVLLHEMNEHDNSFKQLQKVIEMNPQHAEALNFMAYDLVEKGKDLERALDLVNRALQVQPDNGFYLDTRGWVYFKMNKFKEATSDLEKAVHLTKSDPEIAEHLADVYRHLEKRKDALQIYKDALDNLVDSNDPKDKESAQRIREKIQDVSNTN